MIIALAIVNIIIVLALTFFIGYYLGSGKIEINRTLNKTDSAKLAAYTKEKIEEAEQDFRYLESGGYDNEE
jgi:hypothetical protein